MYIQIATPRVRRYHRFFRNAMSECATQLRLVLQPSWGRSLAVAAGWRGSYTMCPDYGVSHEQIFENGSLVAVFGFAGGTISGTKWKTPASWLGVVENGRVKEWRVDADNKPVYDILAKK